MTDKVALETALGMASEVIDASSSIAFHWVREPGWPVIYASPNVRRWGYALEQFLARRLTYLDLVHPQDCGRLVAAFATFIQEKRDVFRQTYRVCWADGAEHWVDEETHGVFGPDGRLLYFHGIVTDVTEREQAEQGLKRQLDLQALVAQLSSRFVDAAADTLEPIVGWALERIGTVLEGDRCYLFRLTIDNASMDMSMNGAPRVSRHSSRISRGSRSNGFLGGPSGCVIAHRSRSRMSRRSRTRPQPNARSSSVNPYGRP